MNDNVQLTLNQYCLWDLYIGIVTLIAKSDRLGQSISKVKRATHNHIQHITTHHTTHISARHVHASEIFGVLEEEYFRQVLL